MGMPPLNDGCVGRGRGLWGCHPSMMCVWGGEGTWIMWMPPLNDRCTGRGRGLWGCHPSMMSVRGGDVDYVDATPQ